MLANWKNTVGIKQLLSLRRSYRWHRFVYGNHNLPVRKGRVNVYYWTHGQRDNVGDYLSPVIVRRAAEYFGIDLDQGVGATRRLYAVGSIIQSAQGLATVWGSGLLTANSRVPKSPLDVRAVRGPRTRARLIEAGVACPNIYGDPAILLPLFYKPSPTVARDFVVVPHYTRQDSYRRFGNDMLSTLTSDWQKFIDSLVSARLVISSSLHGLIIAEAYGVPAIALADVEADWFKYDDYYESTERKGYLTVSSVEEALNESARNPQPVLGPLQDSLLRVFPTDLWKSARRRRRVAIDARVAPGVSDPCQPNDL